MNERFFLSILFLTGFLVHCSEDATNGSSAVFRSLDPKEVIVEGEIGRRRDLVSEVNIPQIDLEKDFLDHFRNKSVQPKVRDGFVGIGMLLDALVKFAYYSDDQEMIDRKNYLIDALLQTRETDGYIGIFAEEKRQTGWDTHEAGYIILALANDYLLFGNKKSLEAAIKYSDYLIDRDVEQLVGLDEGFLQLYHATHNRKYVDYCIDKFRLKEFYFRIQHHSRHVYGHMERALMQLKLNEIDPDPSLLYKPKVAVEFLVNMDGLDIIGSSGQWEHFTTSHEGKNACAESCATAYIIWLLDALLKTDGKSFYGDIMERSIYNALFAALSPSGDSIRYFTDYESAKEYYPDDYFCCPNNFRRIMADLAGFIYYGSEKGLMINLYNNSEARMNINNTSTKIRQETIYPTSGKIKIFIDPEESQEFEIKLRIPLWCKSPSILVNGSKAADIPVSGTFFSISRKWEKGDVIDLNFPMEYRFILGKGQQWDKVALRRGPLIYGINDIHNPDITEQSELTINPASIGSVEPDESIRPDGLKCKIGTAMTDPTHITFTEFTDPAGIKTFFQLSRNSERVSEDELVLKQY